MSALNVVKQKDRVVLITDGAVYDVNTGVIRGFPTKAVAVPSWPGVVAVQGTPLACPLFAHHLSRFQSWDSMVAEAEDNIRAIHEEVRAMCRQGADEPIILAGWSERRNQSEAYTESLKL